MEKELKIGAGDRIRTDDNHVGNVMLYQLSYTRSKKKSLKSLIKYPKVYQYIPIDNLVPAQGLEPWTH